jgi:hypothetical protein
MAKLTLTKATTAKSLAAQINAALNRAHADYERDVTHAEAHRLGQDAQKPSKRKG